MHVSPLEHDHLPQLLELVNLHLAAVVPGWSLTADFLSEHLQRDHTEPVTDPWVIERTTLCAVEEAQMLAAAHLLRYGDGEEVGETLRGVGEVSWMLARPRHPGAAAMVLAAAREHILAWGATREEVWGGGIFVPAFCGVPDSWPHVREALENFGYRPGAGGREALYGGGLASVPAPGDPPLAGLAVRRTVGHFGVRFAATLDGEEVGHCECAPDLTRGGALPALRCWAELQELWIRQEQRNRGIGGWLVRHAVSWLRIAGCGRIVIPVAEDDEAAGAGRFYQRFGWEVLVREIRSWTRESPPPTD